MACEERRLTRVSAELVKVTYCPSRLVLKSPFQVLHTTQGENSEFSHDTLGVRAKGVEGYSINPNLQYTAPWQVHTME